MDNTQLSAAVGVGDSVRDRDRAGVKTQIVGLDLSIGGASETLMNGAMPCTQSGAWSVTLAAALPAGSATVGGVNLAQYTPASGRLPVDGSGVTQPVSDGGGSLTVDGTVGVTGPVAVTGTFWQATQPVSAASLPLPAGAATSARQDTGNTSLASLDAKAPALGQALGAASLPVVLTAAQLSALTPLNTVAVTGTFWQATQPVSGTVAATQSGTWNVGTLTGITNVVHVDDNAGSLTVDGTVAVSGTVTVDTELTTADLDTGAGTDTRAVVGLAYGAAGGGVLVSTANPLPVGDNGGSLTVDGSVSITGTVTLAANSSVNLTQLAGTAADTNSGTKSAGTLRVVLATDQPSLTNAQPANLTQVGGAAVAAGHGTAAGALRVELPTDGTGLVGLNAGTAVIGKVGIDQTTVGTTNAVTPVPAASGGPSTSRVKAAASTNATSIKASAGQVYGWYLYNNTASAKFLKLYNKASAPTVGTDTPLFTVPLPANGGTNIEFSMGIPFGTGIAYAITGAVADSDTTSTAAEDVHGVLLWR